MGRYIEAPQDYLMVHVLHGVQYIYVLEQMTICTENVIRPVPHLPVLPEHALSLTIPLPWDAAWEEVTVYVLQERIFYRLCNNLIPYVPLHL